MLVPMTEAEKQLVVKNVVSACKDITKLNKRGYNFVMLSSGFIAHYDLNGFKCEYEEAGALRDDILRYQGQNQWSNFRPGEQDYEYNMAKKDVYNRICEAIQ